ncbi:hypothetical protein BGW36DRAFT_428636 [Talaromyces proteolyticus]|uniref:Uncharacterized protein n=1 Tax=Talaromyces proteolyticus TaxID=1131652 RepID=A0AAD4KU63_9EURO|nr:uncharacterized protein BGW36DRAFT_428636 [Talaromyces proteolyticus]KAH8696641.1 hypothetical protein BGW36DRAFT_428636 [Talaromyces proteolyticus]
MSSSDDDSEIDLLKPAHTIRKTIRKAHAAPREIENRVVAYTRCVIVPALSLKTGQAQLRVSRERYGLEQRLQKRGPIQQLLKPAIAEILIAAYETSPELREITLKVYPPVE